MTSGVAGQTVVSAGLTETAELSPTQLTEVFRWLVLSRVLERTLCDLNPRWFPAEGEEATIVGSFYGLRPDDCAAPHYRGPFVVYLMRGAELARLVGQCLAKATGYSRGRSPGFTGPVGPQRNLPWVAGDLGTSLGVATGAGLAFHYERSDRVCVVTFGDGTANRGDFHENINLAACWRLPVVYVCQNNHWSISLHASHYLPSASVADRAVGYGIPGELVDGNDVVAVYQAVQRAVARARDGQGPTLIEARTYRMGGHWAADEAKYRNPEEVAVWAQRDPVRRLESTLLEAGILRKAEVRALWRDVEREVASAVEAAQAAPSSETAGLGLDEVYAP